MELYIISDPNPVKAEAVLINGLFEAGLQVFHLRKPFADRKDCADLLREIDEVHHPKVALHQYHELAADFGLLRLHYPEQMRMDATAGPWPSGKVLSTSLHELSGLNQLTVFEYIFLGPVFDSLSKPGYKGLWSALNKEEIVLPAGGSLRHSLPKIIALGGIEESKVSKVREMGFDGLALLGAVWKTPSNAVDTFKKINALC